MKPRVVILGGAGAMGRITAADFLRTSGDAIEVVIADRDLTAAADLDVTKVPVDVSDPESLRRVLDAAFAVIASLPYRFNLAAMHGALAAGAHYVDLGGLFHVTRQQLGLDAEFRRAGRMGLLGIGSAPGIINVLAVLAARDLDAVREVHCLVGSVDRTRYREAPPLGFGYSVDTLLDEFVMPSAVFRGGAFAMVPALAPSERLEVRFPPPVGRLVVDTTLHSEVATLPLHFAARGVREVTFRQGFDRDFMEKLRFLVELGLADTGPLPPSAGNGLREQGAGSPAGEAASPRQTLLALLSRFPAAKVVGKPARYEVLRALVRGRRGGRAITVTADCHAGPRAGGGVGPDIDTGAPPSIAVQLMLSGELAIRPGLWAPEQVVPVGPFVRELTRRGMKVTRHARSTSRRG
jgi:saccharopine dehydrogenase-like NADP-dependent oxidoreductase